jgi:hypothetical protein
MQIFIIVLISLLVYFFFVFVVIRMVFPFMGFKGVRLYLPLDIPTPIKQEIEQLESKSHSQEDYLKLAYGVITKKWHAARFVSIFRFRSAFRTDLIDIWNSPGYAHCTTQNYMLFVLLAGSRFFAPEDIKIKTVFFNFFIHQYLSVCVSERWVAADPGGAGLRGLPLGAYIRLFG